MKKQYFLFSVLALLAFAGMNVFAGIEGAGKGQSPQAQPTGTCILFDGMNVGNNLEMWYWGQSNVVLSTGTGTTARKNSLKWVLGNEWGTGWTGMGFTAAPVFNLAAQWRTDSCKITLKCEAGVDTLRLQFESGAAKKGIKFKPIADNVYHTYTFALRNLVYQENTSGFDSSSIQVVGLMTEATAIAGKIVYISDWWVGNPAIAYPAIFFNGVAFNAALQTWSWGQSTVNVQTGAGPVANSNAVKWVMGNEWGNGWTGIGATADPTYDLGGAWGVDSIKFKLKCEAGVDTLRVQLEGGGGKKGLKFKPIADNAWHSYVFPLRSFVYQDNTTGFDSSNVNVVGLMAEATAIAGKVVYVTDWWTGRPFFDVIPPNAPTGVSAFAGTFQNVVTWTDVPGETGEKYDIYYSKNPITDVTAPGVEVVKLGIAENAQLQEHLLFAPGTTQSTSYYYAVVCRDAAGNASTVGTGASAVTNNAKGIATIGKVAPTNFVADGQFNDWAAIPGMTIKPSDGSGHIVANQVISGDADCSGKVWVAVAGGYLYVAFDMTDDIVSFNPALSTYLNDAPDLYLGLYNWHGLPHTGYQRGAEPDYHFRFAKDRAMLDGGVDSVAVPGANYYWAEKFPTGYAVEAKISLQSLATRMRDSLFVPVEGMRLPYDVAFNDADATGQREGILTYSPYNEDQSWNNVSRWLYNWVGNLWNPTGVNDNNNTVNTYSLSQNYPNPFNPSTQIKFSVKEAGLVTLKVYDVLGREIATLVNETKAAGSYVVNFDASKLASGMYLYKIESGSFSATKKMLLVR